MGANYSMLVVRSVDQKTVAGVASKFLSQKGLAVASVRLFSQSDLTHDNVIFVGPPSPSSSWVPLTCQSLGYSETNPYSWNSLAAYLSKFLSPAVFLWSHDSGWAAGYSVYEHGALVESDLLFHTKATSRDYLYEGAPAPDIVRRGRLASHLNDAAFSWQRFATAFDSLEAATGALASRFNLAVHLLDASSLVEGEPGIAVAGGKYEFIDLVDWVAVTYE